MKIFQLSIILLIIYSKSTFAVDYSYYHKNINKAEKLIFLQNNFTEGLVLYQNVFEKFDFVYLGDCITALQISLYTNDKDKFLFFAQKAFQNGMTYNNLCRIRFINFHKIFQSDSSKLQNLFIKSRKTYLKKIDTTLLKEMTKYFAVDQLNKNGLKFIKETEKESKKRYTTFLKDLYEKILQLNKIYGIPSDRKIGISQNEILKELKIKNNDLIYYYKVNKNTWPFKIFEEQFKIEENLLCSIYFIVINIHAQNVLHNFDTTGYFNQILLGNIHPKDVALLLDNFNGFNNIFLNVNDIPSREFVIKKGYFGIGERANLESNSLLIPDSIINTFRRKFYINDIEIDRAKWKFMKINGMKYKWGYDGTRC